MANQSLFRSLHVAGQLLEVPMDDVDVFLPSSGKRAIGTRGLNGCSCVVVLGSTAIVLAHISPYPGRASDMDLRRDLRSESHEHHEAALTTVANLVIQHKVHFPPSTTAWGIFGWSQEAGHLHSVKEQVQARLRTMGYEMMPAFYKQMDAQAIVPPKGELVGFIRNDISELWLERTRLWPPEQETAAAQSFTGTTQVDHQSLQYATLNTASSGTPAGTRWDGQHYRSIESPAYVWINGDWALRPATASATQDPGTGPAESQWDGQFHVSTQNSAYVWSSKGWILRPPTTSTALAGTAQSSNTTPAQSQWDGQYYVSKENSAYVWINGNWTLRPQ